MRHSKLRPVAIDLPWQQVEASVVGDTGRDGQSWAPDSVWCVKPKPYIPPPQRTSNSNLKACVWNHNETNYLAPPYRYCTKAKQNTQNLLALRESLNWITGGALWWRISPWKFSSFVLAMLIQLQFIKKHQGCLSSRGECLNIHFQVNAHSLVTESCIFPCSLCKACCASLLSFHYRKSLILFAHWESAQNKAYWRYHYSASNLVHSSGRGEMPSWIFGMGEH